MADGTVHLAEPSYKVQARRLSETMKTTAGCRFIAAKRLENRDKALTRLTAFASAYVIILTTLPYFLKTSPHITDLINLFTVACAIITLISSLLQYSNNAVANAEQHHRSGLEINEIRRDLEIGMDHINDDKVLDTSCKYNAVLQKFSVNHDDVDYRQYQFDRPNDYPWITKGGRTKIFFGLLYERYVPSATLLILSALVLSVLIVSCLSYLYAAPPASAANQVGVAIQVDSHGTTLPAA